MLFNAQLIGTFEQLYSRPLESGSEVLQNLRYQTSPALETYYGHGKYSRRVPTTVTAKQLSTWLGQAWSEWLPCENMCICNGSPSRHQLAGGHQMLRVHQRPRCC